MFTINQNLIDDFADKINEKEKKSNKVTSLSSSSTDTQYPSAKCVYDTVDVVDDKVSVVYNTVSIIDTSDSVYDADRWTEAGTMTVGQSSSYKFIGGGSGNGYVIYDGNISNLDNYDITLNLKANKTNTNIYINDNNIGTLPTSQTSILFKKRDGVVKVVYNNNQYNASAVKFMSSNAMSITRYTIDIVLYQGMIYDVIDSIPSKTSDLTNDSNFLTSHQSLDSKTVTVEEQSQAETGFTKTYIIKQGGVQVGNKINIPKDFLVKSASVKTVSTANNPVQGYIIGDKYLDFVVNSKDNTATDEHLYVLVSELVDTEIDWSNVQNKPTFFDGNYNNLTNKPTIPTATSDLINDGDGTNAFLSSLPSHNHDDKYYTENEVDTALASKQATLVSGTNLKTINNTSLLGSGNISISNGSCVTDFFIDTNTDEWVIETSACSQGEVVTAWEQTLSDSKVPSEKLVKDTIDDLIGSAIQYIQQ